MMRFIAGIDRFLRSWAFLKLVLAIIAVIVLLYLEEDWRGAHAWAATKAKWEAESETFDLQKLTPPKIPDNQNLAASPLFNAEGSSTDTDPYPVTIQKILHNIRSPSEKFPRLGNWQKGEPPDLPQIKDVLAENYRVAFPGAQIPVDPLARFEALYPFVTELRATAAQRPLCRFTIQQGLFPADRPLRLLTSQITLSKYLTLHAILALNEHQADLALADLKTNYLLLLGVQKDPSLVGGLVAIALNAIADSAIGYGLELHAWNDAQLADLQQTLGQIDFLAAYQFSMRAEAAETVGNIDYVEGRNRHFAANLLTEHPHIVTRGLFAFCPQGWYDQNKSRVADSLLPSLGLVDPDNHRVFPSQSDQLQAQIKYSTRSWDRYAPWKIFYSISSGPVTSALVKFAQGQVVVDQTRIALALERYHLAHGQYPSTLDALVPACINDLPHDIIDGQPYRYRLQSDGTFLLYSVGWNQTDDGGKVIFRLDAPNLIDPVQGDWVWPTLTASLRASGGP